jgi:hypothetical protein
MYYALQPVIDPTHHTNRPYQRPPLPTPGRPFPGARPSQKPLKRTLSGLSDRARKAFASQRFTFLERGAAGIFAADPYGDRLVKIIPQPFIHPGSRIPPTRPDEEYFPGPTDPSRPGLPVFFILRVVAVIGLIFYLSPLRDAGFEGAETPVPTDLLSMLRRLPQPVQDRILSEAMSSTFTSDVPDKGLEADPVRAHAQARGPRPGGMQPSQTTCMPPICREHPDGHDGSR